MHDPASRRRVLKNIAALGAAGTVSTALASTGQRPQHFAQAQSDARARASDATASGGLPRIQLLIGPGTLPSVGKDRMDLLRYRVSGNRAMTEVESTYDLDQRIEQAVREVMGRTTRAAAGGNAMAASWHFNVDNNGVVHLQARFEGYDGTAGDAHDVVEPGGNFHNLTYEQLKRAGAGTIRVKADGSLTMTSDPLG